MATVYSGWSSKWRPSGSSVDKQFRTWLTYSTQDKGDYIEVKSSMGIELNSTVSATFSNTLIRDDHANRSATGKTVFESTKKPTFISNDTVTYNKGSSPRNITVSARAGSTTGSWNQTLTASAEITIPAKTYTITYNANGGDYTPAQQIKYMDIDITLAEAISKTGYTQVAWTTDPSVMSNDIYEPGGTYTLNESVTLYAVWESNEYSVRYNKNNANATGSMPDSVFPYGISQQLSTNAFESEDYTFVGWAESSAGPVRFQDGQYVTSLAETGIFNIYAKWEWRYTPPNIESVTAYRVNQDLESDDAGEYARIDVIFTPCIRSGEYIPTSIKVEYSLAGQDNYILADTSQEVTERVGATLYISSTLLLDRAYDIRVTAEGRYGGAVKELSQRTSFITAAEFIIDISPTGHGVAIGTVATQEDRFEINENWDVSVYGKSLYEYIAEIIYPIGSIYMSMTDTSPASLFGGTWERLGVGRTLISAGGGENPMGDENTCSNHGSYTPNLEYFPVGETGGELFHTLTVAEMPSHSHQLGRNQSTVDKGTSYAKPNDYTQTSDRGYMSTPVGGGRQHNNMPPYFSVYMWKRIA